MRGLRHTPRKAADVDPTLLQRIDLLWSVATGLSEGDNGVSTFGPVLRLTVNKDVINTATDVTLELGVLSCVADDRR